MAGKKHQIDLPGRCTVQVEAGAGGLIRNKERDEPVVRISGPGFCIVYGLITENVREDASCFGALSQEQLDAVEEWFHGRLPVLRKEAGLRHFVQFETNSKCYYDFLAGVLIGATGEKEKKGRINGRPCRFTASELEIVRNMTEAPNARFSEESIIRLAGISDSSLAQTICRIKKYDASLHNTFWRESGSVVYRGNPQRWSVGERFLDLETVNPSVITFRQIFDAVAYPRVLVCGAGARGADAMRVLLRDDSPEGDRLDFLFPSDLIRTPMSPAERSAFYFGSSLPEKCLLAYYKGGIESMDALWASLRGALEENFTASLGATSYFGIVGELPRSFQEIRKSRPAAGQMELYLKKLHKPVRELLESTYVARDFFSGRSLDIGWASAVSERVDVFDYIVAAELAVFYYCQCPASDVVRQARSLYFNRLQDALRRRFPYAEPEGGAAGRAAENSRQTDCLAAIREALALLAAADPSLTLAKDYFEKYRDLFYEFGISDFDSLIPHPPEKTR